MDSLHQLVDIASKQLDAMESPDDGVKPIDTQQKSVESKEGPETALAATAGSVNVKEANTGETSSKEKHNGDPTLVDAVKENKTNEADKKALPESKSAQAKKEKSKLRRGMWTVSSFCFLLISPPVFKTTNANYCYSHVFHLTVSIDTCFYEQVEEEEYAIKVIQYYRSGLFRIPDGLTVRTYLAKKLNCDPMRITKKFSRGACETFHLGKRVHNIRGQ